MDVWTFKARHLEHQNHMLQADPFIYAEHKHLHPGNAISIAEASRDRETRIPYSHYLNRRDPSSRLVTEDEYYNTGRDPERANKNRPEHIIERMMKALDSAGFHVRVRWTMTYEGSKPIKRLDQIFFVSDAQIRKARRFCSDFMLQIDATFNKNKLQMPLVNIVGVDNHEKTFTVALSFVRAEASIDFKFIFDWLDQLVFFGEGCRPKVLISDQAAGLHGAVVTRRVE
jgi:hypothetical protein